VNCPHCGSAVICAACGVAVGDGTSASPQPTGDASPAGENTFLIVARGHEELLSQLKEVVGDLGWVRLVEDRRHDESILPREGRQGTVHIDQDLQP
jgi:hypothetical protein